VNVLTLDLTDLNALEKVRQAAFERGIEAVRGEILKLSSKSKTFVKDLTFSLAAPRFFVYQGTGKQNPKVGEITGLSSVISWVDDLDPGEYRIKIQTNSFFESQPQLIFLEGGDSLVLNLVVNKDGQAGYQRQLYMQSPTIRNTVYDFSEGGDQVKRDVGYPWRVGVVENWLRALNPPRLDLMAVIEPELPKADFQDQYKLNRPGLAWFQVRARDAQGKLTPTPPGLKFYPLEGYQGPAYAVRAPNWPEGASPVLDVYWIDRNTTLRAAATLERKELAGLPRVLPPDLDNVIVESVTWEPNRPVETKETETREQQKRDCLVVRLRFPPGKPYFVGPEFGGTSRPGRGGFEHNFYLEAGRYTGVFWNVSEEQFAGLEKLQLYSVDYLLKNQALKKENWELKKSPTSRVGRPPIPEGARPKG
jgi:hypothetical protein